MADKKKTQTTGSDKGTTDKPKNPPIGGAGSTGVIRIKK